MYFAEKISIFISLYIRTHKTRASNLLQELIGNSLL